MTATRVRDWLGPAGPLARALDGYEHRPAQLEMAEAVERALDTERVLVCEAGTGTGKTLAYLLPAILSGRKVVVSTATKALQDQIFQKDLPLVERVFGLDPRAVLVKGLGNYLCLRRFGEFRDSPEANLPERARAVGALERFAATTSSGDVAELEALSEDHPVWAEVRSSSDTRVGAACARYEACFVTKMRREAERARLLVVNHHLFFADLALRGPHAGGVLPPYDAVIFDEAHQLEDVATSFFGVRVSSARVETVLRDAERALVSAGLSDRLARRGEGSTIALVARDASERLFSALAAKGRGADGRAPLPDDAFSGDVLTRYHDLDSALDALATYAKTHPVNEAVEIVARRAEQLRDDLASVVEGGRDRISWIEARARSVAVGASPIEISGLLRARVFESVPAVVLTSATLATSDGFGFLEKRLGLVEPGVTVEELRVESPFDFETRAMLYVPRDLPDPTSTAWLAPAAERVAELVAATGGGAFVLCTSNRAMRAIHDDLARRSLGLSLFVQGDAPKGLLLDRFRRDGHAVLVATMSFWEGVDVPGHALRLVVLDKIPFAVPTDPIVVARSRAIEAAGGSAFSEYGVPSAAISLKQGFGRLLRTRDDAGVVALLDPRVLTRSYGKRLLASLPPARRTESLDAVRAFVRDLGLAGPRCRDADDAPPALHPREGVGTGPAGRSTS